MIKSMISQFIKNEDGFLGLVSAGLGLASSIFGKKSAAKQGAAANQGFDYLKGNDTVNQAQSAGQDAMGQQGQTMGLMSGLLGFGDPSQGQAAFDQYKESTGYQFRVDQGMAGIEGSRAARGVLNSGASAKALQDYGQGMASQEFGNYMDQTSRLAGQQGQVADRGLNAALGVGSAGSSAAAGAAGAVRQGAEDQAAGIGGLIKGVTSLFGF
jgi:hypothetical protein